jgi:UDP-N-acetylglucosamine acyltransferase
LFAREAQTDPSPLAMRVETLARLDEGDADIALMVEFLRRPSARPLCAPRAGRAS